MGKIVWYHFTHHMIQCAHIQLELLDLLTYHIVGYFTLSLIQKKIPFKSLKQTT